MKPISNIVSFPRTDIETKSRPATVAKKGGTGALCAPQLAELDQLETVVREARSQGRRAARSLHTIREKQLYRSGYSTFEAYCMSRWGITPVLPRATRCLPISYYGGKAHLAPKIIDLFPPHNTFIEPFFGGGAVFFRKTRANVEIINDADSRIVNLFRVLREPTHARRLRQLLRHTPYSREEHAWCKLNSDCTDPVESARRFFVMVRQSFNGRVGDSWGATVLKSKAAEFKSAVNKLELATERLRGVVIDNRHFRDLLPHYDKNGVLIYLDPPYVPDCRSRARDYKHEMSEADHIELLKLIKGYRHAKVALSGYDNHLYRKHLTRWTRHEFPVVVKASQKSRHSNKKARGTEIVWTNF